MTDERFGREAYGYEGLSTSFAASEEAAFRKAERGAMARHRNEWVVAWTSFAVIVMALEGAVRLLSGFASVSSPDGEATAGTWLGIGFGILLIVASNGLAIGGEWARVIGILVAIRTVLLGLSWLIDDPVAAIALIVVSAFVITALRTGDRRFVEA